MTLQISMTVPQTHAKTTGHVSMTSMPTAAHVLADGMEPIVKLVSACQHFRLGI